MGKPIMATATAVWLVDNTTMTFKQIADFVGMHELEVQGIADGDVAAGVKGFDPIVNNQLTQDEIDKAQADPLHALALKYNPAAEGETRRRGPRYTPVSKRQDRPNAILWLVKFHPELADSQIVKLVGTTKPTIAAVRDRSHWNISNMQPIDPVALGLCRQSELDAAVQKAAARTSRDGEVMSDDERRKLVSTETSLSMDAQPRIPTAIEGLENFSLAGSDKPASGGEGQSGEGGAEVPADAHAFFNLPGDGEESEGSASGGAPSGADGDGSATGGHSGDSVDAADVFGTQKAGEADSDSEEGAGEDSGDSAGKLAGDDSGAASDASETPDAKAEASADSADPGVSGDGQDGNVEEGGASAAAGEPEAATPKDEEHRPSNPSKAAGPDIRDSGRSSGTTAADVH